DGESAKARLSPNSGWITGVAGSSAVVGAVTAGSTSQVTRTRAAPSSARARFSATTAATGSPCQDALPTASGRCIADFIPGKWARIPTQPEHTEVMASPVTTAVTPGSAVA